MGHRQQQRTYLQFHVDVFNNFLKSTATNLDMNFKHYLLTFDKDDNLSSKDVFEDAGPQQRWDLDWIPTQCMPLTAHMDPRVNSGPNAHMANSNQFVGFPVVRRQLGSKDVGLTIDPSQYVPQGFAADPRSML